MKQQNLNIDKIKMRKSIKRLYNNLITPQNKD